MKKNTTLFTIPLSLCLSVTACSLPLRSDSDIATIKIVAFNDFHGQLESPGALNLTSDNPLSTDTQVGGIAWMAGYISHLKKQNPNFLVVSAGDIIGATPLLSALFHHEGTIEAMNRLGLDFNAAGNHEFDAGKDELKRMQNGGCHPTDIENSCRGADAGTPVPFEGAHFRFLAANVIDEVTGNTLFPSYAIKTIDGVPIGFIGMTLKDTKAVVSPSGIIGLNFLDEAATANALVPTLRSQGVETIVLLLHQGGTVPDLRNLTDINQCVGNLEGSPIQTIVKQLDDAIDLVISGHTHKAYNCRIANSTGRLIPVTSANAQGRLLTDIDMYISRSTGDATRIRATNIAVNQNNPNIAPNEKIDTLVSNYNAIALPLANRVIGTIGTAISKSENAAGESALGDIIADARLAATNNAGFGPSVAAFINPGAIRTDLTYKSGNHGDGLGNVTYAEAYAVTPFEDKLVTLTLSGAQIHTLLEQQFTGCSEAYPPGTSEQGRSINRILKVSKGFSYRWQEKGTPCDNVNPTEIKINGIQIDPAASYRITVNNFLANGGDQFYILQQGKDRTEGPTDLEALESYFRDHPVLIPDSQDRILHGP